MKQRKTVKCSMLESNTLIYDVMGNFSYNRSGMTLVAQRPELVGTVELPQDLVYQLHEYGTWVNCYDDEFGELFDILESAGVFRMMDWDYQSTTERVYITTDSDMSIVVMADDSFCIGCLMLE